MMCWVSTRARRGSPVGGLARGLMCFSLAVTLADHASPAEPFEFVVIGDTRPSFESENFKNFESLVPKINGLKPALVINVGDLIYGYGLMRKEKQWDRYEQVVRTIQVPYHQLPGNHDVFSKEARRVYGRHFGRFYESFDYDDYHFVLLDGCEESRWGRIGPAQFEWLKADLARSQARSVFVFLHFPLWEPERIAPAYYEFWAAKLHPLFKQSRVRAVFGGHYHSYGPTREFDGIRYYITGGGGAELRPNYKKAGGEHHFLRVKVSGDTHEVRVVTGHGELTDAEADVTGGLQFADRHSTRIGIRQDMSDLRSGVACSVALANPGEEILIGKAEWILDASAFSIEPRQVPIQIPPGGSRRYAFTLRTLTDTASLQSLPRLEFALACGARRFHFHREVHFLKQMRVPYRQRAPDLDGRLTDWEGVPFLALGGSRLEPELRARHDGRNLYLAITVPAAQLDDDDEIVFSDDLQVGFAERLDDVDFAGDSLRLGLSRSSRKATDRNPGKKKISTVPGVTSVCRTEGVRSSYEIAVPIRLLKGVNRDKEGRLVLNLSYPVPDLGPETEEPAAPRENSFSYQVRYGGASLVPVHFVELALERKK